MVLYEENIKRWERQKKRLYHHNNNVPAAWTEKCRIDANNNTVMIVNTIMGVWETA
jgi:hypothetical protein